MIRQMPEISVGAEITALVEAIFKSLFLLLSITPYY